ncbi:MAG: VWA domain-containing protein, partial [Myxococcota bacterium]|nr:VWA domain-containing protein [Myxococcota bacterium]
QDKEKDKALTELYRDRLKAHPKKKHGGAKGSGRGGIRIARWLGDIQLHFPPNVVSILQKDAIERLGIKEMLLEPEILSSLKADVKLVMELLALQKLMPERSRDIFRQMVIDLVEELRQLLALRVQEGLMGVLKRSEPTLRPRFGDIHWQKTILKNLSNYQKEYSGLVVEQLHGHRRSRKEHELERIILAVDQSGSMETSVLYASIYGSILASLPALDIRLITFNDQVFDLTDQLEDPVSLLFGMQLGGGTSIQNALCYVEEVVVQPEKTHVILITDLMEGGSVDGMFQRVRSLCRSGVQMICLLSLNDEGAPSYSVSNAQKLLSLGIPVFACSPDRFPSLIAHLLNGGELSELSTIASEG